MILFALIKYSVYCCQSCIRSY